MKASCRAARTSSTPAAARESTSTRPSASCTSRSLDRRINLRVVQSGMALAVALRDVLRPVARHRQAEGEDQSENEPTRPEWSGGLWAVDGGLKPAATLEPHPQRQSQPAHEHIEALPRREAKEPRRILAEDID